MPLVRKVDPVPAPPRIVNGHARKEQLAINVFDLTRIDETIRAMLLGGKLDLDPEHAIKVDPGRMDETAVTFVCDLLTAASASDVIRGRDREAGDHPTRVYLRRIKAWERLPVAAVLTRVCGGELFLDPGVFPPAAASVPIAASAKRLF